MNLLFIIILAVPIIEIFLMIEIGVHIGALNTVLLIIFTAVTGIYYAKLEGLNTLRSWFNPNKLLARLMTPYVQSPSPLR